jgi:predicted nucleic acid binding AN1-type Zn finger protein
MERCSYCNKKKLILMDCLCGKKLCLAHRYAEFHYCDELKKKDEAEKAKLLETKIQHEKLVNI